MRNKNFPSILYNIWENVGNQEQNKDNYLVEIMDVLKFFIHLNQEEINLFCRR